MNQEELLNNELGENELKTEKSRKLLVIIVILLLLGGTYYYNSSSKNAKNDKQPIAKVETRQQLNTNDKSTKKPDTKLSQSKEMLVDKAGINDKSAKEINNKALVVENKEEMVEKTRKKQVEEKTAQSKFDFSRVIKPTDKTSLIRLASIAAGKPDPFAGSRGKIAQLKPNNPVAGLPQPPVSINGLPTIGSLPNLNFPQGQASPFNVGLTQDTVAIKGFLGDEVIVSINGAVHSLKANESFHGLKVLYVDAGSMIAKFKRDGQIFTRGIKNLTELENKSDIRLVKDLNR